MAHLGHPNTPRTRPRVRHSATLALGFLLLGCADGQGPPADGTPRLTAQPVSPVVDPTDGVTPLDLGGRRDGLLFVPSGYSHTQPAPFLVAFHGSGGSASNWTGLFGRAEALGIVVLAVDSRGTSWDLIRLDGYGPDIAFLDQALNYTYERVAIDPDRSGLVGFSDGATYTLSIGLSNGDLFGSLIAFSPGYFRATEPIVGKANIFISHGRSDPILPFTASSEVIVPRLDLAGYDITFVPFDGAHAVPVPVFEQAMTWFLTGGSSGPMAQR